jgi:hypothetical protein
MWIKERAMASGGKKQESRVRDDRYCSSCQKSPVLAVYHEGELTAADARVTRRAEVVSGEVATKAGEAEIRAWRVGNRVGEGPVYGLG